MESSGDHGQGRADDMGSEHSLPIRSTPLEIPGTTSDAARGTPDRRKPAIFPLYTSTPIDRKPHSDSRQITFLHPGYTKPGNILIQLEAFDEGEGGQTGIYAHTAWLTCVIMAANAEYHTLGRPQHQCCCCHGDWLVCNGMNNNG